MDFDLTDRKYGTKSTRSPDREATDMVCCLFCYDYRKTISYVSNTTTITSHPFIPVSLLKWRFTQYGTSEPICLCLQTVFITLLCLYFIFYLPRIDLKFFIDFSLIFTKCLISTTFGYIEFQFKSLAMHYTF